jgi:cell division protein FtsL
MDQQQNKVPIIGEDQQSVFNNKPKKNILSIIVFLVIIFLLFIGVFFIFNQTKKYKNEVNNQLSDKNKDIVNNQNDNNKIVENKIDEKIAFTIWTDDGEFLIPTSANNNYYKPYYDWQVSVDGSSSVRYYCDEKKYYSENVDGKANYCDKQSIKLSGLSSGNHKIVITPTNGPTPSWGFMFGFDLKDSTEAANIQENKDKIISVDAPLTTMAFFPGIYDGEKVKYMFSKTFYECRNLINGVVLANTYSLPNKVTELNDFMSGLHAYNESLETPIDLSLMSGFIGKDNKIESLESFMYDAYYDNYHLIKGMDLSSIEDWFLKNTTVKNLRGFMAGLHQNNYQLIDPTNFLPLKDWFFEGTPIEGKENDLSNYSTGFSSFMSHTYDGCSSLFDLAQITFPNWIKHFIFKYPGSVDIMENIFVQLNAQEKTISEPKWEDGSVLSSIVKDLKTNVAGIIVEPHNVYIGRCGMTAPQENKQKGNPFSIDDMKCPEKKIVVDEKTTSPVGKMQMCPDLKYGDKHLCVELLQEYLNANEAKLNKVGQVGSDKNETEYYCHYTERALIKFQQDNNIPVNGMFDKATKEKIYQIGDFYQSDYNFTKIEYGTNTEKGVCPPGEWRIIK